MSSDEGESFQLLEVGRDFPGKITLANVTFCEGNAIITYSRSMNLTNAYDWRLQEISEAWFGVSERSSLTRSAMALISVMDFGRRVKSRCNIA